MAAARSTSSSTQIMIGSSAAFLVLAVIMFIAGSTVLGMVFLVIAAVWPVLFRLFFAQQRNNDVPLDR